MASKPKSSKLLPAVCEASKASAPDAGSKLEPTTQQAVEAAKLVSEVVEAARQVRSAAKGRAACGAGVISRLVWATDALDAHLLGSPLSWPIPE